MATKHLNRIARAPCDVLLIEDSDDARESLRLLLSLLGHRVEVAADGLEGVFKGVQTRPDVAIIDIGLPKLDGYEVARQLRKALGHSVLLIACTAYDRDDMEPWMDDAPFDAWLVKPAKLCELVSWLERADEQSD